MKNIKKIGKKLKICGLIFGCSVLLSGCGVNDAFDHVDTTIQERIDENIQLLGKLKEAGLLDETNYKTLEANLKQNVEKLQKEITKDNAKMPDTLKSASVWFVPKDSGDGRMDSQGYPFYKLKKEDGTDSDEWKYPKLQLLYKKHTDASKEVKTHGDNATPYNILSDKDQKFFENLIGTHVYVLNSDDTTIDIANISAACKKIKDGNFTDEGDKANCYSVLQKYFKDSGETLLESNEKLIVASVRNTTTNREALGSNTTGAENYDTLIYAGNMMGVDLALVSDEFATATFRINELNKSVIDKLLSNDAFTSDKYLVQKVAQSGNQYNAIYLMEYPVSYIDSIEYDKTSTKAKVNTKTSESIKINIMTGEVINIHGKDILDSTTKNAMEKLFNVTPTNSSGQSSFILWDKKANIILSNNEYTSGGTKINYDDIDISPTGKMTYNGSDVVEGGKKADTNSILLRDYLELTYMPGVVSEEERFVTLGRRIRINDLNSDGTVKDIEKPFANFVNKDGVAVDGGSIMITDLLDIESGNKDNEKKNIKLAVYDDIGEKDSTTSVSDSGFTLDTIENVFEKTEYKDKISITMQFPVEDSDKDNHIAVDDASYNFGTESRGIYYGMATDINIFTSNLYSSWINVNDTISGGLKWWNSWLENNKYSYRINEENLLAYLGLNFTAQMQKAGTEYITFNKETVKNINNDIAKMERVHKATWVRTMFTLLGFIIIIYALLLISAWVVDTATANSIGLLKILTGGNCVAVQDNSDIPSIDASSTKYVTFGTVLIRAIIIISIGLLLAKTDILALAGSIFNAFKGFGTELFNRIFNL